MASANAFTVTAGQTNEVKFSVQRLQGFDGRLRVHAVGLPEGVSADPVEVEGTAGEAVLRCVAAGNTTATNAPLRIEVTDPAAGRTRTAVHELVSSGDNNGVPQGFRRLVRETVPDLWISVLAATEDGKH